MIDIIFIIKNKIRNNIRNAIIRDIRWVIIENITKNIKK